MRTFLEEARWKFFNAPQKRIESCFPLCDHGGEVLHECMDHDEHDKRLDHAVKTLERWVHPTRWQRVCDFVFGD